MELLTAILANPLLTVIFISIIGALFINGATDSPSAVATVIATGVLPARTALFLAAVMNFVGTYLGGKVALTIASGIVSPKYVTLTAVLAAMIAIIAWGSLAWWKGLPISKSHSLVAALAGAGLASGGFGAWGEVWSTGWWNGWTKIIAGLFFSPLAGFIGAYVLAKVLIFFFASMKPRRQTRLFNGLQVVSSLAMATSHGSNDGTKFVGVAELALILAGVDAVAPDGTFPIHPEIILLCAVVIGLGTYFGGWPIIVKIGKKLGEDLTSWQGFATETASSTVIFIATSLGVPISTTHSTVSAIAGSSFARFKSDVSPGVAIDILRGWILTFPFCGATGWGMTMILTRFI